MDLLRGRNPTSRCDGNFVEFPRSTLIEGSEFWLHQVPLMAAEPKCPLGTERELQARSRGQQPHRALFFSVNEKVFSGPSERWSAAVVADYVFHLCCVEQNAADRNSLKLRKRPGGHCNTSVHRSEH